MAQFGNGISDTGYHKEIEKLRAYHYALVKEIDDWIGRILATLDKNELTDNTLVIFVSDYGEMLGAHSLREKIFL